MRHRSYTPVREGPIPDPDRIVIPDKATPVFQERVLRLAARLVATLNDLFPPPPGRKWDTKYNAKVFPDMILLRAPYLSVHPVPLELLEHLTSLADWQRLARSLNATLKDDAEVCMAEQVKSEMWGKLNDGNPVAR